MFLCVLRIVVDGVVRRQLLVFWMDLDRAVAVSAGWRKKIQLLCFVDRVLLVGVCSIVGRHDSLDRFLFVLCFGLGRDCLHCMQLQVSDRQGWW